MEFQKQPDRKGGWVHLYQYLQHIQTVAARQRFVDISLEDIDDVLTAIEKIAAEDTKESAPASHNSKSMPCDHENTRSGGLGKPDICNDCGSEL